VSVSFPNRRTLLVGELRIPKTLCQLFAYLQNEETEVGDHNHSEDAESVAICDRVICDQLRLLRLEGARD
jgi:hypothetical protein